MELEKIIYKNFINESKVYYDRANIKEEIIKLEIELKVNLSKHSVHLFERLLEKISKLQNLENLHLIDYVLKNYAKDYLNKKIIYK